MRYWKRANALEHDNLRLSDHGIFQHPDAFDFDADSRTGLKRTNTRRSACGDQIPWLKRHKGAYKRDYIIHAEDHLCECGILLLLAIDKGSHAQPREIHFIAAYALTFSIILRAYWFFVGNNYARSGFPMFWKKEWYKAVFGQVIEYTKLDRGHIHIGHNSLAGASYAAFFAMCGFEGVTGMALYAESNPGGFWDRLLGWTIPLLGGSFRVHTWHHLVAWLIIVFTMFHFYIAIYDTQLYKNGLIDSIIAGPKFYEKGDHDADKWLS